MLKSGEESKIGQKEVQLFVPSMMIILAKALKIVLNWANMARPLYLHVDHQQM